MNFSLSQKWYGELANILLDLNEISSGFKSQKRRGRKGKILLAVWGNEGKKMVHWLITHSLGRKVFMEGTD